MDERLMNILKKLEGMTVEKVNQALQHFPYYIRVSKRDGQEQWKPTKHDKNRVNVEVENGVVTKVLDLG